MHSFIIPVLLIIVKIQIRFLLIQENYNQQDFFWEQLGDSHQLKEQLGDSHQLKEQLGDSHQLKKELKTL